MLEMLQNHPDDFGNELSEEDTKIISFVYNYSPCLDEDGINAYGQIKELYKIGGMSLIKAMVQTAKENERLINRIMNLQKEIDTCRDAQRKLKDGEFLVHLD